MLRKLLNSALASAYSHKDAISFRAIRANVQKLKAMEGELFASRRSFVNFFKRKKLITIAKVKFCFNGL